MKIAMLAPIAWRTPPEHYGPWERVTSLLTEMLVINGIDVTLFATTNSITRAKLDGVCSRGYEEDPEMDAKVWECLHISHCFEQAHKFDLIHNQFDFLPLTYSKVIDTPIVTTIHGFSSPKILPVYKKYNETCFYVSISHADRSPELTYEATIYHGIDVENFHFLDRPKGDYLLFFSRVHPEKGAKEAINIARKSGRKLVMAGVVQDKDYFREVVEPAIRSGYADYLGSVGPEQRNLLLGNALALLHPINFNEPFGLSVVEAMACGTPVIAFNRGSMPEIIRHGRNGFLASSVEEAAQFVEQVAAIDRYECRKSVEERFTSSRMAREYIELYERILTAR